MNTHEPRANRRKLPRPRLLPVTIAAMSALFAIKSVTLVQAAAEEAGNAAHADDPITGSRPTSTAGSGPSGGSSPAHAGMASPDPAKLSAGPPKAATESTQDTSPVSEAERAVLLDLRHRRETLDARAHELDQREADLAAADRRLGERVQQLAALQTRLEGLEASRRQHNSENWAGLVKVYESMKPREAASIFDVLDMQVLLQVLDRMQERRAAPVLAAMQPDRARLATQLLAEMRTRAVTPSQTASPPIDPKG